MAAKPKGIWVIAETPHTWQLDGAPSTNLAAWYLELDGNETIKAATERAALALPLRTKVTVISDATATTYDVAPTLTETKT